MLGPRSIWKRKGECVRHYTGLGNLIFILPGWGQARSTKTDAEPKHGPHPSLYPRINCWRSKQVASAPLAKSAGSALTCRCCSCCCCSICNFSVSKTTGRTKIMKEVVPIHKAALENLQRECKQESDAKPGSCTKNERLTALQAPMFL